MIFYVLGVIAVNIFFEPLKLADYHPAIQLTLISLGLFFLSASFFGRISFFLMFFAGILIGSTFLTNQIYVFLSLMPTLLALLGGRDMGRMAFKDLSGSKNFFYDKQNFIAYIVIIIFLSLVIGAASPFFPNFNVIIKGLISSLTNV